MNYSGFLQKFLFSVFSSKMFLKKLLTTRQPKQSQSKPSFPLIRDDTNYNPREAWQTISELGDGAFGKVYKVQYNRPRSASGDVAAPTQPSLSSKISRLNSQLFCAAKIIPFTNSKLDNQNAYNSELKEYYSEIHILSLCNTEFIIKLIEAVIFENSLWVVIEYCDGGALDDVMLTIDRPLNEKQILASYFQCLQALEYLHSTANVIHRDIKAGNLLLTSSGLVKLADFGVSAVRKTPNEGRTTFIG